MSSRAFPTSSPAPMNWIRMPLSNPTVAIRMAGFFFLWLFIFLIPADEQLAPIPYWVGIFSAIVGFGAVLLSGRLRRPSEAHYPLLVFVCWAAASYIWSESPENTLVRLQTYVQLAILVWLIWEFAPDCKRQASLMRAYVLGTLLPAGDTLYNFANNNQARTETLGMSSVARYTAGSYNENDLGLVLALSLPFSCYLAFSTKNYWLRIAYCLQMFLVLAAIILTASRMAFVVAILTVIVAPLLIPKLNFERRLYILGGLLLITTLAAFFVPQDSRQRLSTTMEEATSGTLDGRLEIWQNAWQAYESHPLLGVGTSALADVIGKKTGKPYVAHNTYLSILTELGSIGAGLAAIIALTACLCVRALPILERRCWILAGAVWCIGVATLSWEHRKPTWFLFGLLVAQAGAVERVVAAYPGKLWKVARA